MRERSLKRAAVTLVGAGFIVCARVCLQEAGRGARVRRLYEERGGRADEL